MLSIQWLFFCNSSGSYYDVSCNDIRWCCVYFAASPLASTFCPNAAPCDPAFTSGDLHRNDEFYQAFLFSIFWSFISWGFRRLTKELTANGVFRER